MASNVIHSTYAPLGLDEYTSVPQLMTQTNPDSIPDDKVIHIDTIANKSLTYGGLRDQAACYAHGVRHKLGLNVSDIILCVIPNSTDFVLLAHSVWWCGGVFCSMNTNSTSKDMAHALGIVKPKAICVYPEYLESMKRALGDVKQDPKIITILQRAQGYASFPDDFDSSERLEPFDTRQHGLTARTAAAVINFSSGTTGSIKAVSLSHYALIANTLANRASHPSFINGNTREAFFPPYCHVYGLVIVLLQCCWLGNFTYGMHKFELELFCQLMEKMKANWAHIVPPVAVQLANADVVKRYDLSQLERVVVSAAPVKKELQTKLKQRFGENCKVIQGYGMTECPTVAHQMDSDEQHALGSIGRPLSGTEVRLVNPVSFEEVVEIGKEGELWVRAPQICTGYLNNPEATKSTFSEDGEWLRTGDIVARDEKGYFWVVDRLKEMIKYKGLQVPPSELEGILLKHSDVTDSAVCSRYDEEQATELPVAYISLKDGIAELPESKREEKLQQIRQWVDGQVAPYKKLRGGVFHLQQLPKTPSGKILRRELPVKKAEASRRSRL